MPEVLKRMSLARQIDKVTRKESQEKASKGWLRLNAESVEMVVEDDDSEEERVNIFKQKKSSLIHLKKLQQELKLLLSRPLQPNTFSHRYLAGAGVSSLLQDQFEELARHKQDDTKNSGDGKRSKLVVIGQNRVEPLQALKSSGHEVIKKYLPS
ncbi:DEAD-box ATP-dependent RNA helicase 13-like [Apium graveolens]|uniref:DEAD-box ATP-dependent RNA helicase 13-like n=1 Tax=Apium graveolens TaxID=4045 RepID=UPI003D7A70B7